MNNLVRQEIKEKIKHERKQEAEHQVENKIQYNNTASLNNINTKTQLKWGYLTKAMADRMIQSGKLALRVIRDGNVFVLGGEFGTVHGVPSGKLRKTLADCEDQICIGDWVLVQGDPSEGNVIIEHVLERKTCLKRKAAGSTYQIQHMAANIDRVFICTSLNEDLNFRKVERFATIAQGSGSDVTIVLTKSDLVDNSNVMVESLKHRLAGVEVVAVNSMEVDGYKAVENMLKPNYTYAFIGSSGVGKSTLINSVMKEDVMKTSGIRNDDKGRHTTTHREAMCTPNGSILIDMPGVREIQLYDESEGLDSTFNDVVALADACKFSDCKHGSEPGCAVREAIEQGILDEDRYNNYMKMNREVSEYWKKKGKEKYKSSRKRR